jgi:hypothetical protein
LNLSLKALVLFNTVPLFAHSQYNKRTSFSHFRDKKIILPKGTILKPKVHGEKQNGKSIFMSSHMFEEVETFKIEFLKASDFESMRKEVFTLNELRPENNQIILDIDDAQINELLLALSKRRIKFISEVRHDLEEYFMGFYNGGEIDDQ